MWDVLFETYNCDGFLPTINVAGNVAPYTTGLLISGGLVGGQSPCCQIIGDETTPENVTFNASTATFTFIGCDLRIAGMKLISTNGVLVSATGPMTLRHRNMWYADSTEETFVTYYYPAIIAEGPTRVTGRKRAWTHCTQGGMLNFDDQTVNLGSKLGTFAISIASPAVVTWVAHGQVDGTLFSGKTNGALPTGIQSGKAYFVKVVDADHFQLALTPGGTSIITTGAQSGTHTGIFDPPRGDNYSIGVNRAQVGLQRTAITGWFVAGNINGVQFNTTIAVHFLGILNVSSATGLEGLFPFGMTAMNVERGGFLTYDDPIEDITYIRADAYGNSADGYGNNVERAFNSAPAALAHMARRSPDPGYAPPVLQVVGNYAGSIVLIDLPGVALAYLRGNIVDPSLCSVIAIQNRAVSTKWVIEGFTPDALGSECLNLLPNSKTSIGLLILNRSTAASGQLTVGQDAYLETHNTLSVIGNAGSLLNNVGGIVRLTHQITFVGAIDYSVACASVSNNSENTLTFPVVGSATGPRYAITKGAGILRGADTLPGSTPGTCDKTGWHDMGPSGSAPGIFITPQQFGAEGDGVTDDTASINAAISYLNGIGGGILFFPSGTYLLDGPNTGAGGIALLSNVSLLGSGRGATVIRSADNSGVPCIVGTSITNFSIEDLTADGNRANQTVLTHAISIPNTSNGLLSNLHVMNSGAYGIAAQVGTMTDLKFEKLLLEGIGADGFDFKNHNDNNSGLFFNDIDILSFGQNSLLTQQAGIDIRGVAVLSNIFVRALETTNVGIRFRQGEVDPMGNGYGGHRSSLSNFYVDGTSSTSSVGVFIAARDVGVSNGYVENCSQGVIVDTGDRDAISNVRAFTCDEGFLINGSVDPSITGCSAKDSVGAGITVEGGSGCRIIGNSLLDNGTYGVRINGGTSAVVMGNYFDGNTTSAITNAGTLTKIAYNTGYVTENSGSFSGSTNGSGDASVTHGLSATPKHILATPTGTTYAHLQISVKTSTLFAVRVLDAAGAPIASTAVTFDWRAWT